jgi:iron complex transport system substrate-binding protein
MLPSLTESVCALGQCNRLVGVDRYSNFPPQVRALPHLGGGMDPNIEGIVALRPDLVLSAASSQGVQRLRDLGLRVLVLEPQTHADVHQALVELGAVLGVGNAESVWRAMDAELSAMAAALPATVRAQRVYFEVNDAPYAASESSFIGQTLKRLGVINIVPGSMGTFPKLNPEFVVRANPDVIMMGEQSRAALEQRPGWRHVRAVQEQRVCSFTAEQSDVLVRPGPRMAEAARLMVQCLSAATPRRTP